MIIGLFLPQMVAGHLNAGGTLVQRERVRRGLAQVDPVGNATRWGRAVKRRTYSVPCPNALWHMDAHMKLIRYKFSNLFLRQGCIQLCNCKCNCYSIRASDVIDTDFWVLIFSYLYLLC